jgi:hypothetical protein
MHEKAADKVMGCQGHGLDAMALASVAGGKVSLAVLHLDDAMVSDGHAVRGAAERVADVLGACERPLSVDDPRLGLALVGAAPHALGRSKGGGLFRAHHGRCDGAGVQRVEALATEDRARGMDGQEATRRGGSQRVPSSARAPPGPRPCPWPWAPRVCSQGCTTWMPPSWPPSCWRPHGRRVGLAARQSRVRRGRWVATTRAGSACGSVKTQWKYGTGRRAAWRSAPHGALVRVCHVGPWRLRPELEA